MTTVRRLQAGDRASWQPLWEGYLGFYRAQLPDDVTDATFARLCAGEDLLGLVAVDDSGTIVGIAHLVFHAGTFSAAPYCYLEDLFVDPQARGSGVARELFHAIYAAAGERHADRVYWHTQEFNARARSLYDQVGDLTSFVVYRRGLSG